jgi:hypothetical protein
LQGAEYVKALKDFLTTYSPYKGGKTFDALKGINERVLHVALEALWLASNNFEAQDTAKRLNEAKLQQAQINAAIAAIVSDLVKNGTAASQQLGAAVLAPPPQVAALTPAASVTAPTTFPSKPDAPAPDTKPASPSDVAKQ